MLQRYILRPRTGRRVSYSRADNKTYRNTGEEQALVRARSCVLSRLSEYRVQTVPKRKSPARSV